LSRKTRYGRKLGRKKESGNRKMENRKIKTGKTGEKVKSGKR